MCWVVDRHNKADKPVSRRVITSIPPRPTHRLAPFSRVRSRCEVWGTHIRQPIAAHTSHNVLLGTPCLGSDACKPQAAGFNARRTRHTLPRSCKELKCSAEFPALFPLSAAAGENLSLAIVGKGLQGLRTFLTS